MEGVKINRIDLANQSLALIAKKDKSISEIFEKIDSATQSLLDGISNAEKYNIIVSIEYLLVRARLQIEFEHISVKQILQDTEVTQTIRNIFVKRDQYLAQLSLKLNTIREDIANLQKVVYTNSNFIKNV